MNATYRLPDGTVAHLQMKSVAQILKDKGMDVGGDAQMFHTQNVLRRIIKYMPYRTGMTIKVTIAQTNIRRPIIITNTPYAQEIYKGVKNGRPIKYTKTKNPLAGPYWDRRLSAAEGKVLARELQNYIRRRGR